jgi:RNA polymerase sigma-70 factor (ECF subfamily)
MGHELSAEDFAHDPVRDSDASVVPDPQSHPDELTAWLSDQYRERLRLFATRRLNDSAAAEDVAQETLRRVLEALRADRVRDRAAIAGFAFETARNVCLQHARGEERQVRALGRLASSPEADLPDVLTSLIGEERRRAVRAALAALPDNDRRVLILTYVELQDSEAIGRALGIAAGAVRVRRHRALKKLTECLNVTITRDREPGVRVDGTD